MIRVEIVIPNHTVATWIRDLITDLRALDYVSLSVLTAAEPNEYQFSVGQKLFSLWTRLDYQVFKCREAWTSHSEQLVEIAVDGIVTAGREVDVSVWLANGRPPAKILRKPKFGTWTLSNATKAAVGFVEQVKGIPVISCELIKYAETQANDLALTTAFVATDNLSINACLAVVRARDRGILLTMIRRTYLEGADALSKAGQPLAPQAAVGAPGMPFFAYGLARIYTRYVCDVVQRSFHFKQWQLAIRFGGERLDSNNLIRVKPDHKGFWADPFVIRREGRTAVFFEEMPAVGDRGQILYFEIDQDGTLGRVRPALKLDYHLSYPFLFEYLGDLFMTPECADAGRIEAFRCVRFPDQWEPHAVLLDGLRAFDPTLVEHNGKWWMFTTIQNNGNSPNDELHLFYADEPFGNWTPHRLNPINVDVRCARPAGGLFRQGEALYRPAQDCSVRYGYALSINKILRMSEEDYVEEEVYRILPDSKDSLGTHTMNQAAGVTIYDCFVKRRQSDGAS